MSDIGVVPYFICGGFGGICTVLVGHPFDTVKVHMQTATLRTEENLAYTGIRDCIKKTLKSDGVRGFYKGITAPLMGVAPIFAISFTGYKMGKDLYLRYFKKSENLQHFSAGVFSGIFTTVIMTPGERIKCLLQIQNNSNKVYSGAVDCFKKLYAEGGVKNIYRGATATVCRDAPASGMYFLTYEKIREYMMLKNQNQVTISGTILAGGLAGMAHWIVGMPFDVLKSRIQIAPDGLYENGMRDAAVHLLETEGLLSFYRGLFPVLLRAFPANAACFLGFELCRYCITAISPSVPTVY